MARAIRFTVLFCCLFFAVGCVSGPFLLRSPLEKPQANPGRLFSGKQASVTVVAKDEQPADAILGGGIVGPKGEQGKGVFLGFVSPKPGEALSFFEFAAKQAVAVLGLDEGPAVTLEITIKALRIDMYRYSGFSPMNCIAYADLHAVLRGAGGEELKSRSFKLTYYENTIPAFSMKEVSKEAISRIYTQAAWEATARILLEQFPMTPDVTAIDRLRSSAQSVEDEATGRELVFWLGLAGRANSGVQTTLTSLFRNSDAQRVRQGAVEALGMIGATDMASEIEAVLSGAKKLKEWDNTDSEAVWYLLKSLNLLGVSDISGKIPAKVSNARVKLEALATFLKTGVIPPLTEAETLQLEKARGNIK